MVVRKQDTMAVDAEGKHTALAPGVEELRERLKTEDQWLKFGEAEERASAATALGKLGPGATAAVGDLIEAARNDKTWKVRQEATVALGKIGGDEALQALKVISATEDDWEVRVLAATALCGLDPAQTHAAVDIMVFATKRMKDAARVRTAGVEALGDLGPAGGPKAVAGLAAVAKTDRWDVLRESAVHALQQIGPSGGPPAVAALAHVATKDSWDHARVAAVEALVAVGPEADLGAAVAALALVATKDSWAHARKAAVDALGKIGPPGGEVAIKALGEVATKDRWSPARDAAEEILVRVFGRINGFGQ